MKDIFDVWAQAEEQAVNLEVLKTTSHPFAIFKKIYNVFDKVFILESARGPDELSEFSIIGFDPEISVTCDTTKFVVANRRKIIQQIIVSDPLSELRKIVPKTKDNRFRYLGGAVGYISYDAIRFWEHLPPSKRKEKKQLPLLEFGIYLDGIIYNHNENRAYYFNIGKNSRFKEIQDIALNGMTGENSYFSYSRPKRNLTKRQFIKMINSSKKYLQAGEIYQLVLSKRISFDVRGDILSVYERLREINPSPYMYLLKLDKTCIIGSSPEMLVRSNGRNIETFPIAGTRPVSTNKRKNQELTLDLLNDEKEIAEHTMLVDLARNDIGKVCEYGTVRVNDLMQVKRFSHVQHIVSHVSGHLDKKYDCYDALRSLFPAGTVSGAPKLRAMEIINELEPISRGAYAGALGYFSSNGSCDFAITIRSIFLNRTKAYIQAGAGIVIDSVPEKEWCETEHKANALLFALQQSKKPSRYITKNKTGELRVL